MGALRLHVRREGRARSGLPGEPRLPAGAIPRRQRARRGREGDRRMSAADQRRALEQTLQLAKKLAPGSDARVSTTWAREANTRFARSEITSNGDMDETRVEVTLAFGRRQASAASNQLSPDALRTLVERTALLARLSPEDPELMPPLPPQRYAPAAPAWDAATAALDAKARADAIVPAIAAADERKLE